MAIEVTTITAPAYWASYLVNGDASGLEPGEQERVDAWLAQQGDWYIVDVDRDEAGEGREARFTWSYDLYGGDARGGDVLDYVAHKVAP